MKIRRRRPYPKSGQFVLVKTVDYDESSIYRYAFSANGRFLAIGWESGIIRVISLATFDVVSEFDISADLENGEDEYHHFRLSLDENGTTLACGIMAGKVFVWNLPKGKPIVTINSQSQLGLFSTELSVLGKILIIGSMGRDSRNTIYATEIFDVEKNSLTSTIPGLYSPILLPDGEFLVGNISNNDIEIRDILNGKLVRTLPRNNGTTIAPNGKFSVSNENSIEIWDLNIDQCIHTLETGCQVGNSIKIWDLNTGQCIHNLETGCQVGSYRFSSDDSRLMTLCHDHTLKMWDYRSGHLLSSKTLPTFIGQSSSERRAQRRGEEKTEDRDGDGEDDDEDDYYDYNLYVHRYDNDVGVCSPDGKFYVINNEIWEDLQIWEAEGAQKKANELAAKVMGVKTPALSNTSEIVLKTKGAISEEKQVIFALEQSAEGKIQELIEGVLEQELGANWYTLVFKPEVVTDIEDRLEQHIAGGLARGKNAKPRISSLLYWREYVQIFEGRKGRKIFLPYFNENYDSFLVRLRDLNFDRNSSTGHPNWDNLNMQTTKGDYEKIHILLDNALKKMQESKVKTPK